MIVFQVRNVVALIRELLEEPIFFNEHESLPYASPSIQP